MEMSFYEYTEEVVSEYLECPTYEAVRFDENDCLTDKESANFCAVLISHSGDFAQRYHFRVNQLDQVARYVKLLVDSSSSDTKFYLIGGQDGYQGSEDLVDKIIYELANQGKQLTGSDLRGNFDRRYWVYKDRIEIESTNLLNKSWKRDIFKI